MCVCVCSGLLSVGLCMLAVFKEEDLVTSVIVVPGLWKVRSSLMGCFEIPLADGVLLSTAHKGMG